MHFILVTLLVLKLERFYFFKDEQEENIYFILVKLSILKLERFISSIEEQP